MARKPPIVSVSAKHQDSLSPSAPKRSSNRKASSPKEDKPRRRSLFLRLFKWCLVLGIWGAIFLAGVLAWYAKDLPDIAKAADFERKSSIIVKASDGSVIARYGEMKGNTVSLKEIPKSLVNAVLATEDRRFYDHPGIDPLGIARAMITNSIKGRMVQGGSTITQQLAKNLFLTNDRNMSRKIQEALLALWIEHQLTKDEILTAYLNRVYLGSGVYGVAAASHLYFDKEVQDLNLRESAILAGLLKAPSRYSPLNNPDLAKKRSDTVLAAMIDAGYITKKDVADMKNVMPVPNKKNTGESSARYYADWILDGLDDLIGTPDMDIIVETTMDRGIQEAAEKSLKDVLDKNGAEKDISQGAAVVMRPDGSVLAMIGGRDYGQSQFNRAMQAMRSPGSSFKPVVYLAALRTSATPYTKILDAPITQGKYRPENFGKKYYGEVTFQEAMTHSMNTACFRIADKIGVNRIIDTARDLGIISPLEPNMSIALGSAGIPMLEMTLAYATIANGGNRVYPYSITRITDTQGRTLYERKEQNSFVSVIPAQNIHDLRQMMQSVIENGTGQRAKLPFPVAGKTGTSQDSRDAWFIGFSDQIVTSVWLGNDDNSPMKNVTGGSYPAEIWREIMAYSNGRYAPVSIASSSRNYGSNDNSYNDGSSSDDSGFAAFLGRIIGSNDNQPQPQRKQQNQKDDYSHLNE